MNEAGPAHRTKHYNGMAGWISGQRRQNPTIYMQDGDNLVIVASIGGNPKNPGWYHNLKAHPDDVAVDVRGKRRRVRARQAGADEAAGPVATIVRDLSRVQDLHDPHRPAVPGDDPRAALAADSGGRPRRRAGRLFRR